MASVVLICILEMSLSVLRYFHHGSPTMLHPSLTRHHPRRGKKIQMKFPLARRRHWKVSSSGAKVSTITASHKLPVVSEINRMELTIMSGSRHGQKHLAFLNDLMEQTQQIAGFGDADLMCQNLFQRGFWIPNLKPVISLERTIQNPQMDPVEKEVLMLVPSHHKVKQYQMSFNLQVKL